MINYQRVRTLQTPMEILGLLTVFVSTMGPNLNQLKWIHSVHRQNSLLQ